MASAAPYWEEYDGVGIDTDARHGANFSWDPVTGEVIQIIADPDGHREWRFRGEVDRAASSEQGMAVVALIGLERL